MNLPYNISFNCFNLTKSFGKIFLKSFCNNNLSPSMYSYSINWSNSNLSLSSSFVSTIDIDTSLKSSLNWFF